MAQVFNYYHFMLSRSCCSGGIHRSESTIFSTLQYTGMQLMVVCSPGAAFTRFGLVRRRHSVMRTHEQRTSRCFVALSATSNPLLSLSGHILDSGAPICSLPTGRWQWWLACNLSIWSAGSSCSWMQRRLSSASQGTHNWCARLHSTAASLDAWWIQDRPSGIQDATQERSAVPAFVLLLARSLSHSHYFHQPLGDDTSKTVNSQLSFLTAA